MDPIWQNITTALEVPPEVADKWLAKLKGQYSLPGRHYHSESQMIHRKAEYLSGASVCIQLASLFQYYHFDPEKDCVSENCDVLKEFLIDAKLDNKPLENNILQLLGDVNVDSFDLPEDELLYFQDLDLLMLGYSPENYKQYTVQLRQEYSTMDEQSYNKMRLKILRSFNRIPFIYASKEFSEKYESTARANIESEIKELENL
ncbi:uncharacterized protein LOC131437730 [Malaya genurostris]|uniref:uncharacterized protein LOC131437730 n=1 Tax=Malaya genurostris TaxID=325434 RepID=UPI0026F38FFF|nr:uncharacterized protein LOC131437730 [Malaya genurostris]